MTKIAILILILIFACTPRQTMEVKLLPLEEVRAPRNCGPDVLPNFGCWRAIDVTGGCLIIAEAPRDTSDSKRLETLGREVFKCLNHIKDY